MAAARILWGIVLPGLVLAAGERSCDADGGCSADASTVGDYMPPTADNAGSVHLPFVPFPAVPLEKPWLEGVDTGVALVGGNGVTTPNLLSTGPIATECPELIKPENVHFMLINLDRSKNRRRRMRAEFKRRGLPMFERVPGVLVTEETVGTMRPPRTSPQLKLADYGCALAHRRAWQRVVDGPHQWVVVMEDDAELIDDVDLTDLPALPTDADLLMFRTGTIMRWAAVCDRTEAMRAYWGFGMVAYLVSKAGASRLLEATANGLDKPLDGIIWYTSAVYATRRDYIYHPPCDNPCPSSVRTWLNGELPQIEFPD